MSDEFYENDLDANNTSESSVPVVDDSSSATTSDYDVESADCDFQDSETKDTDTSKQSPANVPETKNEESKETITIEKELPPKKANKKRNITLIRGSFVLLLCIILSTVALWFIRPDTSSDIFYSIYYFLFCAFTVGVIVCVFLAHKSIVDLTIFISSIKEKQWRFSALKSENKKTNSICDAYKKSFIISDDDDYHKTRANSDLYFGSEAWLQDMNGLPVLAFLKIIPGTYIGFGILGTFIGFAGGLSGIDISDSQNLLNGVQILLNNLRYAFNTSIIGVLASMFLNFIVIHPLLNKLDIISKDLCDNLDMHFFVTEVDAMAIIDENNNKKPFPVVLTEILTRLEGVSSNINTMGLTIGNQVTTSVKETLDKTIEKIIKAEIKKLKEEMNSSIVLLQECQTHLQNAPQYLKEAAINMENSSKNSTEVFETFSKEIISIKNALSLMPDDFKNINTGIDATLDKLAKNQNKLSEALSKSSETFTRTIDINETLSSYYSKQTDKFNEMTSKFTSILDEYKEMNKESKDLIAGFKGMDKQIARCFDQINDATKNYGNIIEKSLESYFSGFRNATKDISKQFADATLALSEEVAKLNDYKRTGI